MQNKLQLLIMQQQYFRAIILQILKTIEVLMEKKKEVRKKMIKIPALHTFLISQYAEICQKIKVNLTAGSAQIFGLELKKNYPHQYWVPCSLPIFTWEGAQIYVEWVEDQNIKNTGYEWGDITKAQSQPSMIKYLQIFHELYTLRKLALEEMKEGPKLAIIGSDTSGISNVSKLMLNYSGKYNMNPLFIDLDPESSSIFVDGTIGVLPFQYKLSQDLFDRPDKLSFYYGNRRPIQKSYFKMVKLLKDTIKRKNIKKIKMFKEKGSDSQYPEFCCGLVIQCPRIKEKFDKTQQFQAIYQIIKTYEVTHLIIIDNTEADIFFNQKLQKIVKYHTKKIQGTDDYIDLPRPIRSKIERYFDKESKKKQYEIKDIKLYQIIENSQRIAQLRSINIEEEAVSKNTIAVMHAEHDDSQNRKQLAMKAMQSSVCCLAYIYGIQFDKGLITLEVAHENFLEDFGNKIWLTSVSDQ